MRYPRYLSRLLFRFQNKTSNMLANAFTGSSILNRMPTNITQVADISASRHKHKNPLVYWINKNNPLTLLLLSNGFPCPSSWPLLLALMNNGTKRRIYIIA